MTVTDRAASAVVVVGVDGSYAASNAILWAVDEAATRDVPLRIVYVADVSDQPAADVGPAIDYAERALRAATTAVQSSGKRVKVQTEIRWGGVTDILLDESRTAALVCIGSAGMSAQAGNPLGSTAAALAEHAECPVAVIRSAFDKPAGVEWIAVVVNDHHDNDEVIAWALNEAQLRRKPVFAVEAWAPDLGEASYDELDRRMARWKRQYPDVHIYPVATRGSLGHFLTKHSDERIKLAVFGQHDLDQIKSLRSLRARPVNHDECSVLIVRPNSTRAGHPHSASVSRAG